MLINAVAETYENLYYCTNFSNVFFFFNNNSVIPEYSCHWLGMGSERGKLRIYGSIGDITAWAEPKQEEALFFSEPNLSIAADHWKSTLLNNRERVTGTNSDPKAQQNFFQNEEIQNQPAKALLF